MTARDVFEEFKAYHPHHRFGYDPTKVEFYKIRIERAKAFERIKQENPYRPPDPKKVRQYNEWKRWRKPGKFTDLPEKVRGVIYKILENHPEITAMWVCGSYASGSWIDEYTWNVYMDLKKEVKGRAKISDLDLIIEPNIELGEYEMKIDICRFPQNDVLKVK